MKKITSFLFVVLLSNLFVNCSNSSSTAPTPTPPTTLTTILENGVVFPVGINAGQNTYTSTLFLPALGATGLNQRGFIMTKSTLPTSIIDVRIFYPPTQTSINGTYTLGTFNGGNNNGIPKIVATNVDYFANGTFNSDSPASSGSVKITDNGNNNYKLEFINLKLVGQSGATGTKTFTGYIETNFSSN
jgi:hypothetical protein